MSPLKILFLLLFPVFFSQTLSAAPITFNTALPVSKGSFVLREKLAVMTSKRDPSPLKRDLTRVEALSVLGYGASAKLAIFGALPYLWNDLSLSRSTGRLSRSANGIGDLTLFARYTALKFDWPQKTWRTAPIIGFQMPTGKSNSKDAFGRKPQGVQPGLGSWNPLVGVVTTFQSLDFQVDVQALYKKHFHSRTPFEQGDIVRLDTSFQYRILPRSFEGGGLPDFLYGVLEANLIHKNKNHMNGVKDLNSGGTTLFLVPGLQYVTKNIILELGVQLPVIQNLSGLGLKNNSIVHVGFRVNI